MPLVVRLGDTGSHGGAVTTSATKHVFEGSLCARVGDTYSCPIHGPNPIITGSPKYQCEGAPIARDGDMTACGASLISGAHKYSFS